MDRLTAVSPAETPLPVATRINQQHPPLVWLVGAHGGAGCTFLSSAIAFAGDNGAQWPAVADQDISPCAVIVARESTSGLDAAEQALRQWHTDPELEGVELLGLVLVAESSTKKLGKELAAWKDSVGALAPTVWRVAWVPAWTDARHTELPAWWPGDSKPEKKKKYVSDIPATVATLGDNLLTAATAVLTEKDEENAA